MVVFGMKAQQIAYAQVRIEQPNDDLFLSNEL